MRKLFVFLSLSIVSSSVLYAQTITEKRLSLQGNAANIGVESDKDLALVNELLEEKHRELKALYEKGRVIFTNGGDEESFKALSHEIGELKSEIDEIEELWRAGKTSSESYDLWHQPEATLLQLIMDYGAHEAIYLVPSEIGSLKVSLSSSLPIPKESWTDCLKIILEKNGVGIRELNPYLRELYFFSRDSTHIRAILSSPEEVELFPSDARLLYVMSSNSLDPVYTLNFLRKFSNPAITTFEVIHGDIFIFSTGQGIKELLTLYGCLEKGKEADYRMVTLGKMESKDMISILEAAFPQNTEDSVRIMPLGNLSRSIFLFGASNQLDKAEKLIRDLESKIEDGSEKVLFWYTAKHSEANDLASVLAKVYDALIDSGAKLGKEMGEQIDKAAAKAKEEMVVHPPKIEPPSKEARETHKTKDGKNNFIVDPKSGSIIMVVEQDALPKIKELLKRLDQPKKMVQIEVLLFEKKLNHQNKSGLNLLRLGAAELKSGLSWNAKGLGILEFVISNGKSGYMPAYDLAYQFLMGQEDIQINASPSVMTVNQTPATIAIVDEMSINNGADLSKDDKNPKSSYSRAQYGITIQITPTITCDEEIEEKNGFVTLETDITFDTTNKSADDRPNVTRRHIKNHVRVADGETVILGGLRRKSSEDKVESIPFLGEIPGIGKLFSTNDLNDSSTEMFVFITPKIVADPIADAARMRKEELKKRPGDIPEFLSELEEARNREKKRLFESGLTALFGRLDAKKPARRGEYEGR